MKDRRDDAERLFSLLIREHSLDEAQRIYQARRSECDVVAEYMRALRNGEHPDLPSLLSRIDDERARQEIAADIQLLERVRQLQGGGS